MEGVSYQLQGQNGGRYLTAGQSWDAEIHNNGRPAAWLSVVQDAVLTEIESNITQINSVSGKTLLQGFGIGGSITSVSVSSGDVIVYYK